jgi:hypothetical protein
MERKLEHLVFLLIVDVDLSVLWIGIVAIINTAQMGRWYFSTMKWPFEAKILILKSTWIEILFAYLIFKNIKILINLKGQLYVLFTQTLMGASDDTYSVV